MRHKRAIGWLLLLASGVAMASVRGGPEDDGDSAPGSTQRPAATPGSSPVRVEIRGRLVCLAEEMRDRHDAAVPPVHDHLLGFRVETDGGKSRDEATHYYTILRTPLAEGLFADERFRARLLVLSARRFPATAIIEVTRYRSIHDGKLHDVYYWCEVCSIKGVDPGPCDCCQRKVELREEPAPEPAESEGP